MRKRLSARHYGSRPARAPARQGGQIVFAMTPLISQDPASPPATRKKGPMPHPLKLKIAALMGIGACILARPAAGEPTGGELVTVVSSKVEGDYSRARQKDGSLPTEYYAFADGGHWTGTVSDRTIDNLPFMDVARAIAGPLQSQNYVPTKDPKATKLLIVVYYGRTRTPEHAGETSGNNQNLQNAASALAAAKSQDQHQFYLDSTGVASDGTIPCVKVSAALAPDLAAADNAMSGALASAAAAAHTRDELDAKNASLLGYDAWWNSMADFKGTPLEHRRQDMIDELEHDRYFVVLMAYDFQEVWKHKNHRLLWQTRYSVQQRGVEFDKQLAAMTKNASQFFGQETHGLVHKELPVGRVEIGNVTTLGTVAQK